MADLSGKVKIIRLFPIIVYQDVTNSNSLRAAGAMSRSSSFFFPIFPGLCRTRSIHFVLLNYLIRTHPSRWASRSLINLILAFIHLALSDCVVSVSSFSLSQRSLSASVGCFLDFVFLSFASWQIVGNRSESQDPILEGARARSHVQFPDIISLRILKLA